MSSEQLDKELGWAIDIFEYLSSHDPKGKLPMTISREIGIPMAIVKGIVESMSNIFVRVGSSERFTINRFKAASKQKLIREFRDQYEEKNTGSVDLILNVVKAATGLFR